MKTRSLSISIVAIALAGSAVAEANVDVAATVPDLAALAKEIGGDKVDVISLALETQDPHFVDARPNLALELSKADLLIAVGLGLEVGWLPVLQKGARNPAILTGGAGFLDCSGYVREQEVPTGKIDRSMGDIHPGGNPHYLYSPREAYNCARAIAARLSQLDPDNAAVYGANLRGFGRRLTVRVKAWESRMESFRGAKVVSYHRSWTYLIDWLGLVDLATFEPKPGVPPSPRHVAKVLQAARKSGAKVILQESYYPSKTGKLVAKKLGGTLLQLPAGAAFRKGETYIQRMDRLVSSLAEALAAAAGPRDG